MSELKDGKVEVMGIGVDISQILGDKIVDQYISRMSEEDVNKILDYIDEDLWKKDSYTKTKVVKESTRNSWGGNIETSLADRIKQKFAARVEKDIEEKCNEMVSTQDYKDKVDKIAQEIIDYASDGYKEDMKKRIRERMVGNVTNELPSYDDTNLISIIYSVAKEAVRDSINGR